MSGVIKTGTSVQSLTLPDGGVTYTWQHNRGQKPLLVSVVESSNGQATTVVTIACPDDNRITLLNTAEGTLPVNVIVTWGVPTLSANSLDGAAGTVQASNGFV